MRRATDLDVDDEIIPDGGSVRVRVNLMDGDRPGYAELSDAQTAMRKRARDQYIKRTCDAWRTAGRDADPNKPDPNAASAVQEQLATWQGRDPEDIARDVEARRRKTHAEFTERLTNAWKSR